MINWGKGQSFPYNGANSTLWQYRGAYKREIIDENGVEITYAVPQDRKRFKTEKELWEYLRPSEPIFASETINWGEGQSYSCEGVNDMLWGCPGFAAYKEEIIDEKGVETKYFYSTPKAHKDFETEKELLRYLRTSE